MKNRITLVRGANTVYNNLPCKYTLGEHEQVESQSNPYQSTVQQQIFNISVPSGSDIKPHDKITAINDVNGNRVWLNLADIIVDGVIQRLGYLQIVARQEGYNVA